jgi:hypothetical protein
MNTPLRAPNRTLRHSCVFAMTHYLRLSVLAYPALVLTDGEIGFS